MKFLILVLLVIISPMDVSAQVDRCGEPPPVVEEHIERAIDGKLHVLSRFLGNAALSAKIQTSRTEIFSRYPDAERSRTNAYFQYQVCVLIMEDNSLSNPEKIEKLMRIRQEFLKPIEGSAATVDGNGVILPRILNFHADRSIILDGQSTVLRWHTTNSSSVTINDSQGTSFFTQSPSGSHAVSPRSSETYVLEAHNDEGISVQQIVTINVRVPCQGHAVGKTNLRSEPGAFTKEEIENMVLRKGFRESDWNPNGDFRNSYEVYDNVVVDCATDLMWQRYGSDQDIWMWQTAPNYIRQLNGESFAGFRDWRLPTIEELSSLLEPRKNSKGLFIGEEFGSREDFWSSDDWITSGGTPVAWSASFDYGGIFHVGAKRNRFFVRAVRSLR